MVLTKEQFLALPSNQRKKLAAERSGERRKAIAKGKTPPPTYSEQFGIVNARGKRSTSQKATPKKATPKKAGKGKPKGRVRRTRRKGDREVLATRKAWQPASFAENERVHYRTIAGPILQMSKLDPKKQLYKGEAKRRELLKKREVFVGSEYYSTLFYGPKMTAELERAKTIIAIQTNKTVTFGPEMKLEEEGKRG